METVSFHRMQVFTESYEVAGVHCSTVWNHKRLRSPKIFINRRMFQKTKADPTIR
jgi:hypothetical protein